MGTSRVRRAMRAIKTDAGSIPVLAAICFSNLNSHRKGTMLIIGLLVLCYVLSKSQLTAGC